MTTIVKQTYLFLSIILLHKQTNIKISTIKYSIFLPTKNKQIYPLKFAIGC